MKITANFGVSESQKGGDIGQSAQASTYYWPAAGHEPDEAVRLSRFQGVYIYSYFQLTFNAVAVSDW